MSKKITVVRVTKTEQEGKFGNYPVVELAYKTDDDKTKGMKIYGFGPNKEIAAVAGSSQQGDVLEAEFHQTAKGFWEFASLKNTGEKASVPNSGVSSGSSGPSEARSTPKGNWETSEERAARQVMIVRQSSLSNAVAFFDVAKVKPSVNDVIEVAKQFEAFVLGRGESNFASVSARKTIQTGDVE